MNVSYTISINFNQFVSRKIYTKKTILLKNLKF